MLAANTYTRDYIDACRAQVDAQLAAYDALVSAGGATLGFEAALQSFEPRFLNNLVVVLEACFVHRTRALEGKDGNPLNEVRMLASSILRDGGVLTADRTIKYVPEASVFHLAVGDPIRLNAAMFRTLAAAFFDEMARRFCPDPVASA